MEITQVSGVAMKLFNTNNTNKLYYFVQFIIDFLNLFICFFNSLHSIQYTIFSMNEGTFSN